MHLLSTAALPCSSVARGDSLPDAAARHPHGKPSYCGRGRRCSASPACGPPPPHDQRLFQRSPARSASNAAMGLSIDGSCGEFGFEIAVLVSPRSDLDKADAGFGEAWRARAPAELAVL